MKELMRMTFSQVAFVGVLFKEFAKGKKVGRGQVGGVGKQVK
jgi:hypothetical protein